MAGYHPGTIQKPRAAAPARELASSGRPPRAGASATSHHTCNPHTDDNSPHCIAIGQPHTCRAMGMPPPTPCSLWRLGSRLLQASSQSAHRGSARARALYIMPHCDAPCSRDLRAGCFDVGEEVRLPFLAWPFPLDGDVLFMHGLSA